MTHPGSPRTAPAVVLVGHGRYEDQWHDVAATAAVVSRAVADRGVEVVVRGTFPSTRASRVLPDADGPPSLLVVVAGSGRTDPDFDGADADWAAFHDDLAALVRSGVPLLAVHAAANAFADSPVWANVLGGRWVPDRSGHPPIGPATFRVADPDHPVTAGLPDVEAFDERYTDLEVHAGSRVLLTAEHDGRAHPVVWVGPGPSRVVYDGLGHDERSFASPSRRRLLDRELGWLLGAGGR